MILVLCGPPGVGKTTIAEGLRDRLERAGYTVRVLHSDDFSRNTYEQLYERVTAGGDENENDDDRPDHWILDGTFYRREYQERFRALPDAHLVYVTASRETALERNRTRENPIEERGVHAMHGRFEEPRNPDLTLDTDRLTVSEAVDALGRYVLTWVGDEK